MYIEDFLYDSPKYGEKFYMCTKEGQIYLKTSKRQKS